MFQSLSPTSKCSGRIRYEFNYEQVTWEEADLSCRMKLGRLAKILNSEQNNFIKREIQGRVTNFGFREIDLFFGLLYNGFVYYKYCLFLLHRQCNVYGCMCE